MGWWWGFSRVGGQRPRLEPAAVARHEVRLCPRHQRDGQPPLPTPPACLCLFSAARVYSVGAGCLSLQCPARFSLVGAGSHHAIYLVLQESLLAGGLGVSCRTLGRVGRPHHAKLVHAARLGHASGDRQARQKRRRAGGLDRVDHLFTLADSPIKFQQRADEEHEEHEQEEDEDKDEQEDMD